MRMRRIPILAAVLVLAAWLPHDRTAPNRWALIIGVSDYMNFGDEIGGDLPGAAWDARRMRDVLIARWGFEPDRIRMVLDRDATRARIISELTEWLPAVVREGDKVIFFFAGHGSQTWNEDGTAEDGLDQTICPTDVLKGDPSMDIRDKELGGYLRSLPTANVVAILDNCHSGTGTRAITPFARPRTLARDVAADVPQPAAASRRAGVTTTSFHEKDILEIASAQSWEVAVDAEWPGMNGAPATHGGAFTTTLVRHLWRVPRSTSYEDLFHLTAEDMKRQRFAQQPLLTKTGAESRSFGFIDRAEAVTSDASVPVLSVSGTTVELGGGAGAGMTVGSIYRAGAATLRVTAVRGDRAVAAVAGGAAPARGARAHLTAYAFPAAVLLVSLADVDADTRSAITTAAGSASGALSFSANPRDFAHLLVRPAEQGYVILGMDGAIRHKVTGRDRWENARSVAQLLKNEAGTHQLASLDNPGQAERLEFGFAGGQTVFRLGDEVRFEVRVPRAGYLTIIDLGTDGRVAVLFPNEDMPDGSVRAGELVTLPAGKEVSFEAQEPTGRGIVRAFVTERPLALSVAPDELLQAGTVLEALRRAAGPARVTGSDAVPTGSWLTASVVYTIER
jgi:hypothetical protein